MAVNCQGEDERTRQLTRGAGGKSSSNQSRLFEKHRKSAFPGGALTPPKLQIVNYRTV
jgi:hypothetical protein